MATTRLPSCALRKIYEKTTCFIALPGAGAFHGCLRWSAERSRSDSARKHPHCYTGRQTGAYTRSYAGEYTEAYAGTYTQANSCTYTQANSCTDAKTHTCAHARSYTCSYTGTYAGKYACSFCIFLCGPFH